MLLFTLVLPTSAFALIYTSFVSLILILPVSVLILESDSKYAFSILIFPVSASSLKLLTSFILILPVLVSINAYFTFSIVILPTSASASIVLIDLILVLPTSADIFNEALSNSSICTLPTSDVILNSPTKLAGNSIYTTGVTKLNILI